MEDCNYIIGYPHETGIILKDLRGTFSSSMTYEEAQDHIKNVPKDIHYKCRDGLQLVPHIYKLTVEKK